MATIYKYPGGNYEFTDEDDQLTIDEVREQLTQYFPELAQADADEATDDEGNRVVTFVKRAGTKGATPDRVERVGGVTLWLQRHAPLLANMLISLLNAAFWGLVTYLLGSRIWLLYAVIAALMTFVGVACVQVASMQPQGRR